MNFEPGDDLQKIISDNKSGSVELLEKLNEYLSQNFYNYNAYKLLTYLKKNFLEFANIQNYLNSLEEIITDDSEKINSFLNNFIIGKEDITENIYRNGSLELNKFQSFITISNSNTLLNYFRIHSAKNKGLSITVCESRPVLEGRIFAEALYKLRISTKLITEAMITNEMVNIEAAIIGADSILQNGNVVNKIGSKLLALACKYFNKPFYVLADKSKFSLTNDFLQTPKPATEIWDSKPADIKIDNYYFEIIEKELITKIFTN